MRHSLKAGAAGAGSRRRDPLNPAAPIISAAGLAPGRGPEAALPGGHGELLNLKLFKLRLEPA